MKTSEKQAVKGYKEDYNTLNVGGYAITLRNFREVMGHDDSLPYAAHVYVNGMRVCACFNDGWGGETNITQVVNKDLLDEIEKAIKGLPYPLYEWEKNDARFSDLKINGITDVTDAIAEVISIIKPILKRNGNKKCIIAMKGDMIKTLKLKVEDSDTDSIIPLMLKQCERKCKDLIADGYIIVNAPQMHLKN